jgi:hypothetical protein
MTSEFVGGHLFKRPLVSLGIVVVYVARDTNANFLNGLLILEINVVFHVTEERFH